MTKGSLSVSGRVEDDCRSADNTTACPAKEAEDEEGKKICIVKRGGMSQNPVAHVATTYVYGCERDNAQSLAAKAG